MSVLDYSTTPASNAAAAPTGAPEGMLPSAVNDTMRQMMANIRAFQNQLRGFIDGLTLSNDGTSPNTVINIAAGVAMDTTSVALMSLATAMTKTTGAWAVGTGNGGLDTGAVAANSWYHAFVIMRPDTGVVDVLFSLSATAPTMPASYTLKRRIGSFRTNGSSQITAFTQNGDRFHWTASVTDLTTAAARAWAKLTLTVPSGIGAGPLLTGVVSTAANSTAEISFADGSQPATPTNSVKAGTAAQVTANGLAQDYALSGDSLITDTASAVYCQITVPVGTLGTATVVTRGWIDRRGRDA